MAARSSPARTPATTDSLQYQNRGTGAQRKASGGRGRLANRFDSIAQHYDRWYDSPVNQAIDAAEKRAIGAALPAGSKKGLLLDVGCGTGHWLLFLKMAGYRVVGLDVSAGMLEVAKGKFPNGIQLLRADAHTLPFEDSCFDTVCCIATLEFVRDPVKTIQEMWRCLRSGGRLVIGALNGLSPLGVKRKLRGSPTFRGAHFFTTGKLKRCLAGLGTPHLQTCAFVPPSVHLLPIAPCLEAIGRRLFPSLGEFIVAWIQKPDAQAGRGTHDS